MRTVLRCWLVVVAFLRVASVLFGYAAPDMIRDGVFPMAKEQVTDLAARTFGIWTLLSCLVTLMCALHVDSKPLYLTTMASFIIALFYFSVEYTAGTVAPRSVAAPFCVATTSIVLMLLGYKECVGEPREKQS